jgi:hypothetical protein
MPMVNRGLGGSGDEGGGKKRTKREEGEYIRVEGGMEDKEARGGWAQQFS